MFNQPGVSIIIQNKNTFFYIKGYTIMTVSKFLMNVAVCALSIGGISTSYGADSFRSDDAGLVDGLVTPARGSQALLNVGSSARHLSESPSWRGIPRGGNTDPDTRSVSSMSAADEVHLKAAVINAWRMCKQSGLPAPKGDMVLARLEAYVAAIIYDRTKVIETANAMAARIAELEAAAVEAAKPVTQESNTENQALERAQKTAEENAAFWRNVAGGLGVVVVSVALKAVYDNWSRIVGIFM